MLFFMVLNEVMGNLVAPLIRTNRLALPPVSLIFAVLALGSAFGLLGALVATPVTGIVRAFYEACLLFRRCGKGDMGRAVEAMLSHETDGFIGERASCRKRRPPTSHAGGTSSKARPAA